jgi:hypothetical protein
LWPAPKTSAPLAVNDRNFRSARALQDECRLGLVEFSSNAPHLLIAQSIGALHHCERVARQGSIGKDIN